MTPIINNKIKIYSAVTALLLIGLLARAIYFGNIEFDSDFGRDSLIAMRITRGDLTLLGPQASVGGFFLGPLYFYGLAALYLITCPNPAAASIAFIMLGIATLFVGFWLLKKYVSQTAGLTFLFLAATHPSLVAASRAATHQPMIPLATIIVVAVTTKALTINTKKWFLITGIAAGTFFHIHFSFLPLVPVLLLMIGLLSKGTIKQKIINVAMAIIGLLIMLTPLIIFDLTHEFITSKAFTKYILEAITGKAIAENLPHWTLAKKAEAIRNFITPNSLLALAVITAAAMGYIKVIREKKINIFQITITTLWITSIIAIILYKGYLYNHYTLISLTLTLLIIASFITYIKPKEVATGLALLIFVISATKLNYPPTFRTVKNLTPIVEAIKDDLQKRQVQSFTVFKNSPDGMTSLGYEYRFLLERERLIPANEQDYKNAQNLYVIDEIGGTDPLQLKNWEITEFNPKKAEKMESFSLANKKVDLYRLTK